MNSNKLLTALTIAALGLLTLSGCANPAAGTTPKTNNTNTNPTTTDGNLYIYSDKVDPTSLVPSQVFVWQDWKANVTLDGVSTEAPFEGANCWKVTDSGSADPQWNGWGIAAADNADGSKGYDVSAYFNGKLNFAIKIPAGSDVKVMMNTTYSTKASEIFVSSKEAGKFVPDGAWHQVSIPVSVFIPTAGAAAKTNYFISFLQEAAYMTKGNIYYIDDVYLTKN